MESDSSTVNQRSIKHEATPFKLFGHLKKKQSNTHTHTACFLFTCAFVCFLFNSSHFYFCVLQQKIFLFSISGYIRTVINRIRMILCKPTCSVCVCVCASVRERREPGGGGYRGRIKPNLTHLSIYLSLDWAVYVYLHVPPLPRPPPPSTLSSSPLSIICCVCSLEKIKVRKRKKWKCYHDKL